MLFSRSVFSLLGRGPFSSSSRRFLSSINVSPPESLPSDIDLTNPLPSTAEEYFNFQSLLKNRNRAPRGQEVFEELRTDPDLVFRDFTPFFQQMDILEPRKGSKTVLLRGRRWGKSVLGQGWLAFLRKEEHLFKGTAVEGKMRKAPLIGIELNLSGIQMEDVARTLNYAIIQELRRLRRVGHKIPKWPSGLLSDSLPPSSQTIRILEQLVDISDRTKLQIALFIDEYDALVIKALFDSARSSKSDPQTQSDDENLQVTDQYRITNEFMTQFFTKLKSMKAIPFQFITGSSRLAIQGFWSGANYITDLSFNPDLAAVLGYTWEQIEQYFPIQLRWLQHLHKLEPEELRTRMEDWYDHHRWSPHSKIHVFNPWSVNKLMETGRFAEHWALTGSNTRVLYSKLLSKELTHLLLSDDQPVTINPSDLVNPRLPKDTERALTSRAQKSLLVGAGMLAMHPDQPSPDSTVYLTIPNREAKLAIFEMLKTGLELPGSFGQAQFESLIADQDFLGLINALDQTGALKATLLSLNDPKAIVSEERLSAAFTMIMQQSELSMIEYRPMAAVSGSRKGRPLTCDQTFHLLDKKTTFVIEFKMTASRQTDTVKRQLIEAFAQCWWRYQDLVKEGFTGAYNVAVFDGASASNIEAEAAMGPLNGTQVENLLSESGFILENLPDKTKGKAPPKEPQAQESQQAQTKKKPPAFNNEQLKQFYLQQWCHKNNVKLYVRPKAAGDSESQVKQE